MIGILKKYGLVFLYPKAFPIWMVLLLWLPLQGDPLDNFYGDTRMENKDDASQNFTIRGKVTSGQGEALSGVEIMVSGKKHSAVTDAQGKYSIIASENGILTFSKEGYETKQVEIIGRNTIDVVIQKKGQSLDNVVSASLGLREGNKSNSSVIEIKGEELGQNEDINLREILTRIVEGVNKSNADQENKNKSRVIIRGNTALSDDNQPLYVIDGSPIDTNQKGAAGRWGERAGGVELDNITPEDIATLRVLKGEAAREKYGSRASNGAIEITTKKARQRSGTSN